MFPKYYLCGISVHSGRITNINESNFLSLSLSLSVYLFGNQILRLRKKNSNIDGLLIGRCGRYSVSRTVTCYRASRALFPFLKLIVMPVDGDSFDNFHARNMDGNNNSRITSSGPGGGSNHFNFATGLAAYSGASFTHDVNFAQILYYQSKSFPFRLSSSRASATFSASDSFNTFIEYKGNSIICSR